MIEIIASLCVIVSIVTMVYVVGIDPPPEVNHDNRQLLTIIENNENDDPPINADGFENV